MNKCKTDTRISIWAIYGARWARSFDCYPKKEIGTKYHIARNSILFFYVVFISFSYIRHVHCFLYISVVVSLTIAAKRKHSKCNICIAKCTPFVVNFDLSLFLLFLSYLLRFGSAILPQHTIPFILSFNLKTKHKTVADTRTQLEFKCFCCVSLQKWNHFDTHFKSELRNFHQHPHKLNVVFFSISI